MIPSSIMELTWVPWDTLENGEGDLHMHHALGHMSGVGIGGPVGPVINNGEGDLHNLEESSIMEIIWVAWDI